MSTLPPRTKAAMLFIQRYFAEHGRAPAIRDIAKGIGLTSSGATHRILCDLEEAGYIDRTAGARRDITILKTIPDDRFEEAAKAVCAEHGCTDPASIAKARDLIFNSLVRSAA